MCLNCQLVTSCTVIPGYTHTSVSESHFPNTECQKSLTICDFQQVTLPCAIESCQKIDCEVPSKLSATEVDALNNSRIVRIN